MERDGAGWAPKARVVRCGMEARKRGGGWWGLGVVMRWGVFIHSRAVHDWKHRPILGRKEPDLPALGKSKDSTNVSKGGGGGGGVLGGGWGFVLGFGGGGGGGVGGGFWGGGGGGVWGGVNLAALGWNQY